MIKTRIQPALFTPKSPADFIGNAGEVAHLLDRKATGLREARSGVAKIILYGPPGTGKTKLAEMFANLIAGHQTCVESINGRNVNIEVVRQWQQESHYLPLYGLFNVKIVNELDTCPPASQDPLLTYLDEMPDCTAFIGTSNMDLRSLSERFQTRLKQIPVKAPDTETIMGFLRKWKLADRVIKQTAVGCGGNVRAALMDVQSILDAQLV